MKLAIVCTHPVQYYAPVFRALSDWPSLEVRVFYGWKGATENTTDRGFGQSFSWDIPLLEGYDYEFVPNQSADPGTHHRKGIDCPSMNQRIAAWGAEALLVYGWCWQAHLTAMRHFQGSIPVTFRGDSTLLGEPNGWRKIARRLALRWIYRNVDTTFYVGTRNRDYFLAHGVAPQKLCFAPHSIDNDRFSAIEDPSAVASWKQELGIAPDALVTLFVGKLEEQKGPGDLLTAFLSNPPDTRGHLIFAGSGPLENSLRENATPDVHFIGFQNQSRMPIVYRLANTICLPSYNETWGLSINEAMACGCMVITSDQVGCAVDLVQDGINGWQFPVGSTSSLAQVLNRVSKMSREEREAFGDASRRIISNWGIPQQVAAIANHFTHE
jgi:glycosyltransferase involved in cell wall biosynthesis